MTNRGGDFYSQTVRSAKSKLVFSRDGNYSVIGMCEYKVRYGCSRKGERKISKIFNDF